MAVSEPITPAAAKMNPARAVTYNTNTNSDLTVSPLEVLLQRLGLPGVIPSTPTDPSFTVIVRTQGQRPRTLLETMASLEAQSATRFNVIVAVHGTESTARQVKAQLSAAESMPREWSVLAVTDGGGRSRPLNAGLSAASGDYITILDDDDLAEPDWLSAFARGAAAAPGQIIRARTAVQTWTVGKTSEPEQPTGPVKHIYADRFDLLAHFSRSETPICSIALPRLALERFGLRFDEDLPVWEDWDLLMRAALLIGVHSIPETTSLYRLGDSANSWEETDTTQWLQIREQVIENFSSSPFVLDGLAARRLAETYYGSDAKPAGIIELIKTRHLVAELPKRLWARLTKTLGLRRKRRI